MTPQNEMAASLRRDGFSPAEIATMTAPGASIADAPNPTQLRWGLNDVMWGDDDSVIVLLSGPDGEPYWLELDKERAAVLRQDLAGPDGAQTDLPDGFKRHACVTVACAACGYPYDEAEFTMHFPSAPEASNRVVSDGWDELKDGRVLCMRGDDKHDQLRHTVGVIDPDDDTA
jgi:hypothetical protein